MPGTIRTAVCILGGGPGGCATALQLAKRPGNEGKVIVTIICDTGERYLSTALFADA